MKIRYDLLYKSGAKDSIVQEDVTEKEAAEFNGIIIEALKNNAVQGYLTFGQGTTGHFVRLSSIDRVVITVIETEADNEKR